MEFTRETRASGFPLQNKSFSVPRNAYSVSWNIFKVFSIFMLDFAGDGTNTRFISKFTLGWKYICLVNNI